MVNTSKAHSWTDLIGAGVSALCVVHCLLTPLVLTTLLVATPQLEQSANNVDFAWGALDFLFLAISTWAVYRTVKSTPLPRVRQFLWLGWLLLASGILLEKAGIGYGAWIMYIGSFAVAILHLSNYLHCRKCHRSPTD